MDASFKRPFKSLNVNSIRIGRRHRKELGDVASLAKSISEIGLLHPIVVTAQKRLVAGHRRLEAVKHLKWKQVPVNVIDLDHIVQGELAENSIRKNFTPSETVAIANALQDVLATPVGRPGKEMPVNYRNIRRGDTRDKVAAYCGVSGRTLEKARAIVEAAQAHPRKYGRLLEDMDRTGVVNGVYVQMRRMRQLEAIRREPPRLPERGPYRVIVVDAPWQYDAPGRQPSHRASTPYPTMTLGELRALPIGKLATKDCVLWVWTTNSMMLEALQLVEGWGFTNKTILTWAKTRIGTGSWLRSQTEHCLLATRGRPQVNLTNQSTLLHAPSRGHSRKPVEFYAMVEKLCPASRYCELFSRQNRPKWEGHGDELMHYR